MFSGCQGSDKCESILVKNLDQRCPFHLTHNSPKEDEFNLNYTSDLKSIIEPKSAIPSHLLVLYEKSFNSNENENSTNTPNIIEKNAGPVFNRSISQDSVSYIETRQIEEPDLTNLVIQIKEEPMFQEEYNLISCLNQII